MELEDQLKGDAAGASSARLSERLQAYNPDDEMFAEKRDGPEGIPTAS